MKIAILGWGSLVWDPRELRISGEWRPDGPSLPVEFARVSSDERLTLVIAPELNAPQPTCWAMSEHEDVVAAREDLQRRENAPAVSSIHYLCRNGDRTGTIHVQTEAAIRAWIETKELGAAIWTGLSSNWIAKRACAFTTAAGVDYLRSLKGSPAEKAKEYIVKAPEQIRTPLREAVASALGWK